MIELDQDRKVYFQKTIISWYKKNGRSYNWRNTQDPFKIIMAEITLKLTGAWKAEKAYNYIEKKYGSPEKMARADLTDLQNQFKPLGLFHRSNLLVDMAQDITNRFGGKVPKNFKDLISIKGIGQYTANAVLCFAYRKQVPLVDGSIKRIFSRCFSYYSNKAAYADKEIWEFAENILPKKFFREYNLGLIDLGAIICKYNNPEHDLCPIQNICRYKLEN